MPDGRLRVRVCIFRITKKVNALNVKIRHICPWRPISTNDGAREFKNVVGIIHSFFPLPQRSRVPS